jgi:hypothetical protein
MDLQVKGALLLTLPSPVDSCCQEYEEKPYGDFSVEQF